MRLHCAALSLGALALGALCALPAAAQAQAVTSAYTPFDLGACRQTSAVPEEGDGATWTCPGYRGRTIFLASGDLRYDLDVGADDTNFETGIPFNTIGPRVEWRLRGREAIAIIYRLNFATNEQPLPSVLVVKAIRPNGHSGCITAFVLGSLPDANERARALADDARVFRCGTEEAQRVGFNW